MLSLEPLFFLLTLLIGWAVSGYYLCLRLFGSRRPRAAPAFPSAWPSVSVVIPCYNEEERIIEKLRNLRELDYPAHLIEFIFADGGSDDRTIALLADSLPSGEPFRIAHCPAARKACQMNFVLPELKGEIIFITDADALMQPDALKWMLAEFDSDPGVRVVGAYCSPGRALDVDKYFWASQNKGRLLESGLLSASGVVGPCYAFRKGLLSAFPEDTAADDVYVALLALSQGGGVLYSRFASVVESRGPLSYPEFIRHKFRKSGNALRELMRFLPRAPHMKGAKRIVFVTRLAQQILLPFSLCAWPVLTGMLLLTGRPGTALLGTAFLAVLFFFTLRIFSRSGFPGSRGLPVPGLMKGYALIVLIMLASVLCYPFRGRDKSRGHSFDMHRH